MVTAGTANRTRTPVCSTNRGGVHVAVATMYTPMYYRNGSNCSYRPVPVRICTIKLVVIMIFAFPLGRPLLPLLRLLDSV